MRAQESHKESESGARVGLREAVSERSEAESFMQLGPAGVSKQKVTVSIYSRDFSIRYSDRN